MDFRATSTFALAHPAKAAPSLIGDDDRHFAQIIDYLDQRIGELSQRIDELRRADGGGGRRALDRELEIHQTQSRLATLRRFQVEVCLGRIVPDEPDAEPVYIGRVGLTDIHGDQLLVDWRTPAAEPYFAATLAHRYGLASRRRYRWSRERIVDYWDEAFTDTDEGHLALDDDSAFLAGLHASRSPRMRNVLGTIAADQDIIIRADSHGALVVDGGPGTGKTVVALHRAAYLLYADPRLAGNRGALLVVGPHDPYLAYVSDVLPSLGEEGVHTCTLRDLLPEGACAVTESDVRVARLKASLDPVATVERAVAFYEEPPNAPLEVSTPWETVVLSTADWAEAFGVPADGTPHNESRDDIWNALTDIVADKHDAPPPMRALRKALADNDELLAEFNRSWPILDAPTVVGDLWSVPAYLRLTVPTLHPDEIRALQRTESTAWSTADLPLLDAARRRLGDPGFSRRNREREAILGAGREEMNQVVDHLLAAHSYDDGEGLAQMLVHRDLRDTLVDQAAAPARTPDPLAGPFAHIIVDEAQELTDAEWSMLLSRCPAKSFTIVGDRAQARRGFIETWPERLHRVGFGDTTVATLSVNYRTPAEIMVEAASVIHAELPDASVPTSIRSTGVPVRYRRIGDLATVVGDWLARQDDGIACVIGDPGYPDTARVRSLSPMQAKGLEFDLVVLVHPEQFGTGITGAVDRYVAMTRATQELVVLSAILFLRTDEPLSPHALSRNA